MIDDSKRKQLIYASAIFIAIVILSLIAFLVFSKKENLPPIEPEEAAQTDKAEPTTPDVTPEELVTFKNGIAFKQFEDLSRFAITEGRIDVIRYYLAEQAKSHPSGGISMFTLDKTSIKETKEGEQTIFTFNASDNTDEVYKVVLSYTYSTDTYVQIFDKTGKMVQTSPYDTE